MGTGKLSALDIAATLRKEMPSIGFLSKSKRLTAFYYITARAEELADQDERLALEALELLTYLSRSFSKAALMAARNMRTIPVGSMCFVGWDYAKSVARNAGLQTS